MKATENSSRLLTTRISLLVNEFPPLESFPPVEMYQPRSTVPDNTRVSVFSKSACLSRLMKLCKKEKKEKGKEKKKKR